MNQKEQNHNWNLQSPGFCHVQFGIFFITWSERPVPLFFLFLQVFFFFKTIQYDNVFKVTRLETVTGSETGKRCITCTYNRAPAALSLQLILYTRWTTVSVCDFTLTFQMRETFSLWLNELPRKCIPVAFEAWCVCLSAYLAVANEQQRVSCWRLQFGHDQVSLFPTFDVDSITVVLIYKLQTMGVLSLK